MVSKKQKRINELKRIRSYKKPRESILIVTEGVKTEPIYFNLLRSKLRLAMIDVEIVGQGAVPITVVEHALDLRKKRKQSAKNSQTLVAYDCVYCVVDVESPKAESISRAINKAKDNNIEIILSNPCFEYWYLLHFRKTSSPFHTSQEVISKLKKEYPSYCNIWCYFSENPKCN